MKRLLTALVMLCLAAGTLQADPNDGFTVWGLTADGADHFIAARLGLVEDKIEVGGTVQWFTAKPEWGPAPDAAGAYLLFHINEYFQVVDPSPDSLWENALHALIGRPYVGVEGLIPTQGVQRNIEVNWIAGTLISTSKDFKRSLAIEYITGQGLNGVEGLLTIGARIRF